MNIFDEDKRDPLLMVDEQGVHVASREVAEKLEKKNLSASMITSLSSCPARWVAENFAVKEVIEEEPDNAARRGSLFHKVMENLFAYPAEERTPALMKKVTQETLESEEFFDLSQIPDAVQWLREAINSYYKMGSDPTKVRIAELNFDEKKGAQKGLEIFVKGKIGNASRDILGYIDRVSMSNKNNGSLLIEDWKSGAKSKQWVLPKTDKKWAPDKEGWAEQRQQLIYTMLLQQKGYEISGARLIYPVAQDIVKVDVNNEKLLNRVVEDVEEADSSLDLFIENNSFEYGPSFLCSWCPLATICPVGEFKPFKKARDAFLQQPNSEDLLKVIELN